MIILLKEFKDLTNMKFNHWTVIEYAGRKNKDNRRYWLCECDCENKTRKEISEKNLKNGNTKSCRCIRKKTTEQYKLELEEVNKKNGTNIKLKNGVEYVGADIKIIHICTCGKEWSVTPSNILNGHIQSCGLCHSQTFEQWCIDNNRQDVLDRWDYELNNKKPGEITYGTHKKYYLKCPKRLHDSELKNIHDFVNGHEGSIKCKQCGSFEQWCLNNNRQDVLDRWDYELNDCKPSEILYATANKYYFKCPKYLHESELKQISSFTSGQEGSMDCKLCNSFAQYNINNIGKDFLEKYWDWDKNNELSINPWKINKCANKLKVWIKCQEKDYHGSYDVICGNFSMHYSRCPYCSSNSGKIHPLDSLGNLYPQVLELWSDKNDKSPYEYAPNSGQEVYWKCPEGKHEDYPRSISTSNTYNFRCPECQYSKGEERISNCFISKGLIKIDQDDFEQLVDKDKYSKDYYIPQKTFDGLIGVNNGLLSYDFYISRLNLLIEYHGGQHEKFTPGLHKTYEDFLKQVEHDKRKCEYALNNNIKLLVIWYWDFDKIEDMLEKEVFIHI